MGAQPREERNGVANVRAECLQASLRCAQLRRSRPGVAEIIDLEKQNIELDYSSASASYSTCGAGSWGAAGAAVC